MRSAYRRAQCRGADIEEREKAEQFKGGFYAAAALKALAARQEIRDLGNER
jgi:hypothetical protein